MFYAIAPSGWRTGHPLTPALAPAGLHRTRDTARGSTVVGPMLALAVRYDATRGVVAAEGPVARAPSGGWEAPAILDQRGGVKVLGAIPGEFVRVVGLPAIRVHSGTPRLAAGPHIRPVVSRVRAHRGPPVRVA